MILQKENALQEVNDRYYARYQDVLNQINNEIELQMELDRIDREYEQWLTQFRAEQDQWRQEFELQKQQTYANIEATKAQASYYRAQAAEKSGGNNPYGNTSGKVKLSENGNAILVGFTAKNIKNTQNKELRETARKKIYGDALWGRISDEEAEYLFDYFGL